jgi:2Fe-2S ferredoxin
MSDKDHISKELTLRVTDQDGTEHNLPALAGWRVMEIIRDHDLPIRAECGGSCACATCHVYVDQAWANKLTPKNEDEDYMLDSVDGFDAKRSRLSCQILMTEELDGLTVTLAPGSEP